MALRPNNLPPTGISNFRIALTRTPLGQELWEFLTNKERIMKMFDATAGQEPALNGVARELVDTFNNRLTDEYRKLIGEYIRNIMERHGYAFVRLGVPTPADSGFTNAALYEMEILPPADLSKFTIGLTLTPRGKELWAFLSKDKQIENMLSATDGGNPALSGVAVDLRERFEYCWAEVTDDYKKLIGEYVRVLMERNGCELTGLNGKMPAESGFTNAALYQRKS